MKTRMGPAKLVGVESLTVGNLRSRHSMRTCVFELTHENTERTFLYGSLVITYFINIGLSASPDWMKDEKMLKKKDFNDAAVAAALRRGHRQRRCF